MAMRLLFVETPSFTSSAKGVIDDDELLAVQDELLRDPLVGDLVAGTGGARKIRAAIGSRGKRGGARVLYHISRSSATVFLLFVYAKNESGNLTLAGRNQLEKLVEILNRES
ncbi:MAG TPA: type II toxin-antitoxin system RelE/ParE family toxin [Gemmatimonadaceae bacterium]